MSSQYKLLCVLILYCILIPLLPVNFFPNFSYEPVPLLQSYNYDNLTSTYKFSLISNQHLHRWLEDQAIDAEAFLVTGDLIDTGSKEGRLVEINKKTSSIRTIARFNRSGAKGCGMFKLNFDVFKSN